MVTSLVGDSSWSDEKYQFLFAEPPTPPQNLQILSFDDSFVSFKWLNPLSSGGQAVSGFKIYREDLSVADTSVVEID